MVNQATRFHGSATEPATSHNLLTDAFQLFRKLVIAVVSIANSLRRLADAHGNLAAQIGTEDVARQLGCTPEHVSDLARSGKIPKRCIVDGTGHGKPWRFHRGRITAWIRHGRQPAAD